MRLKRANGSSSSSSGDLWFVCFLGGCLIDSSKSLGGRTNEPRDWESKFTLSDHVSPNIRSSRRILCNPKIFLNA